MPIRMKALRSFGYAGVNEGAINRGHEFTVRDEHRARDLETQDPALAYRIEAKLPPKVNPEIARATASVENKAAREGPLPSAGGKTGAAEPVPSSPPAPQRRRRRSRNSADDLLS